MTRPHEPTPDEARVIAWHRAMAEHYGKRAKERATEGMYEAAGNLALMRLAHEDAADAIATGRVTLARTLARLVAGALLIWSLFNV